MGTRDQIIGVTGATLALFLLYCAVFTISDGTWSLDIIRVALCNAVPAALLGWLVAGRVAPALWPVRGWASIAGIVVTLVTYALATYVATILFLALTGETGRDGDGGLFIRYFTGPAFIWQAFQGLAYGGIALLLGWLALATQRPNVAPSAKTSLGRLLIRTDQGIVPVDAEDIVRIAGADDYTEIILTNACHLARMTMAECETLLASEHMLRVHRSHLVNLRKLVSAEPTGDGRMTLTLANRDILTTSRAGARALRNQAG